MGTPYRTSNMNGDIIWAASVEISEPLMEWLYQVKNNVEILDPAFLKEKFKEYLLQLNIKFPHIVYAQAVLETGNFNSKIFTANHNLFGMKQARVRATTNLGSELGHAMYGHWRESVVDYALFQCAFLTKIKTEEGYYEYLKHHHTS